MATAVAGVVLEVRGVTTAIRCHYGSVTRVATVVTGAAGVVARDAHVCNGFATAGWTGRRVCRWGSRGRG